MRYVITYDIAGDHRREDVATILSGYGPRVQLSVFECDVRTSRDRAALVAKLRELIDPVEDQVRIYPLDERAGPAGGGTRASHRGAARLLDRDMNRYRGTRKLARKAAVDARERAGHGLAIARGAGLGRFVAPLSGG